MNARALATTLRSGYQQVSSAERASFDLLSAFAATVCSARAINYGRERRRSAPLARSLARRARAAPRRDAPRVHHFLPGLGIAFAAGVAAILTRTDGSEVWF